MTQWAAQMWFLKNWKPDISSERRREGRSMGWMIAVLVREALEARKENRAE